MAAEQGKAKASEEELQSLKDHFKDVGFPEYSVLNEDCKLTMMEHLSSRALVRLGMCSKAEKRLVAKFPIEIDKLDFTYGLPLHAPEYLWDYPLEDGDYETLFVKFDDKEESFIYIKRDGTGTIVKTGHGRLLWKQADSDYYKVAVEIFEALLKRDKIIVKEIILFMGQETMDLVAREESPIERLPNTRKFQIESFDSDNVKVWLQKMPDYLELLLIMGASVPKELMDMTQVRTARSLYLQDCDATNEQLLELNAVKIYIREAPNIDQDGCNAFLRRWQRGGGVDGFAELSIDEVPCSANQPTEREFLVGLDAVQNRSEDTYRETAYLIRNNVRTNETLNVLIGWRNNKFEATAKHL